MEMEELGLERETLTDTMQATWSFPFSPTRIKKHFAQQALSLSLSLLWRMGLFAAASLLGAHRPPRTTFFLCASALLISPFVCSVSECDPRHASVHACLLLQ